MSASNLQDLAAEREGTTPVTNKNGGAAYAAPLREVYPAVRRNARLHYRWGWVFWHWALKLWCRPTSIGTENYPASGPCMVLCSHASYLDPVLVGKTMTREAHYLARTGVMAWPLMGRLMVAYNAHPIRRGTIDRGAIATCCGILEDGQPLVLFPEGTRSRDGKVSPPKGGFAMILDGMETMPPCVPVLIVGSHKALGRDGRPRRVHVEVRVGKPFVPPTRGTEEPRRAYLESCGDLLLESWKALGAEVREEEA